MHAFLVRNDDYPEDQVSYGIVLAHSLEQVVENLGGTIRDLDTEGLHLDIGFDTMQRVFGKGSRQSDEYVLEQLPLYRVRRRRRQPA